MTTTEVPLASVKSSKTNPRRRFDEDLLAELTESVRQHGILQPVLVRRNGDGYELVAGHRRLKAAEAAKLETVPALVRDLDDREVLEIQVVENLQREDLDPLEEASGYQRLVRDHGYTVERLAERVGKSKAYVYGRMKLADLPEQGKQALLKGRITPSVALLVARIPDPELADEALGDIVCGDGGEPLSYRQAKLLIEDDLMRKLKSAPFKTNDAELVPEAGACTDCPKRTGNQPDLFGDVSADVCTDPPCFRRKAEVAFERKVADAERKGEGRAATKKEQDKLTSYGGFAGYKAIESGMVDLAQKCWEDPKGRHWRSLLGKDCPAKVLLQDPQSGRTVELVPRKEAMKVLREKHEWAKGKRDMARPILSAVEQKLRFEAAVQRRTNELALARIAGWVEGNGPDVLPHGLRDVWWKPLALMQLEHAWSETTKSVATRRSAQLEQMGFTKGSPVERLESWARQTDPRDAAILGLLVELIAARGAPQPNWIKDDGPWKELCRAAAVDLAALKRQARKELAPAKKKTTKKKGSKKAGKKKGSKRRKAKT